MRTLMKFADHGVPLTRLQAKELVILFISILSEERKSKLPFTNGVPGNDFCRSFCARQKRRLKFGVPTRQERKRWAAANAETITAHFAHIEQLVTQHSIDAPRFWNLDETGASPGVDANDASRRKRFTRRSSASDYCLAGFAQCSRATLLASISASGESGSYCLYSRGLDCHTATSLCTVTARLKRTPHICRAAPALLSAMRLVT